MKRSFQLTFVLLSLCLLAEAKIFRVGYSGPQVSGVDFSIVSSAIASAQAGDTIQLYQNASVGSSSVNKRLVFIGFGYNLHINSGLQAVPSTPNQVGLYFNAGSENSVVQGVYVDAYIGTNNITISRCAGLLRLGLNANTSQHVAISNLTIVSSFVELYSSYGLVSNALISNSIITRGDLSQTSGLFMNNVATSSFNSFGSFVVKNNIFTSTSCPQGNNAVFEKNIFRSNCAVTGAGNVGNIDMSTVFTNWNNGNYTTESNLALKAGSPAIGLGIDGNGNPTDAGIYGGDPGYVYKLSGIPAIPAIYQLTAPQLNANTNPYTITISVRSNN
jgi:hypothetical protein